jgi:hypothetical protein
MDYEMHTWRGNWEIIAVDHSKSPGYEEATIGTFPTEELAQQNWELVMEAAGIG